MNSGKSFFVGDLLEHLGSNTNIKSLQKKIKVLFCYNDRDSIDKMRAICDKSEFIESFVPINKMPSFTEFKINLNNESNHYLIVLEDLQGYLRGLANEDANELRLIK